MSALIVRGLGKLAYRGGRAMGKFLKNKRSNKPKNSYTNRKARKATRTTRRGGRKARRTNKRSNRKERSNKRNFHSATVGNPDRSHSRSTHSRPLKKRRIINKLLKSQVATTTYSISNYGAAYRGTGALKIGNIQAALLDTNVLEAPLHLWELNASPQGTGSVLNTPIVFYGLHFTTSDANGTAFWRAAITSAAPTDTILGGSINVFRPSVGAPARYNLTPTDLNTVADIAQPFLTGAGARGYISGVSVKLLLNSPQQSSTKFIIQLCQLHEEVIPGAVPTDAQTAFWQGMIKPLMFSPLADGLVPSQKKYIKILKTQVVDLEAPESIEDHMLSRTKLIQNYYNLNRINNYKWGIGMDKQNMENEELVTHTKIESFSTHTEPKARVFLMIRAEANQTGSALDNLVTPSYDYVMKFHHKSIQE